MKAVDFIKKFGWDESKVCILNCAYPEDRWLMRHGELISDQDFDDLKRYVDAWELVQSYGGLYMAKADCIDLDGWEKTAPYWVKIKQAIALVEEVYK